MGNALDRSSIDLLNRAPACPTDCLHKLHYRTIRDLVVVIVIDNARP